MSVPFPVLASACLCGVPCRYDARAATDPCVKDLYERGLAVSVCPEILGGLSAPRPPCEIFRGRVVDAAGNDLTAHFEEGARKTLAIARERGITVAVLKDKSPSCGNTLIYDGTFSGALVPGRGVAAAFLQTNGVRVFSAFPVDMHMG